MGVFFPDIKVETNGGIRISEAILMLLQAAETLRMEFTRRQASELSAAHFSAFLSSMGNNQPTEGNGPEVGSGTPTPDKGQ